MGKVDLTSSSSPPNGQFYKVLSGGTTEELESKINDYANKGYKVEQFCAGTYSTTRIERNILTDEKQPKEILQHQLNVIMRYQS